MAISSSMVVAAVAVVLFRVLFIGWTSAEAIVAGWLASVVGSADSGRAGHQLLVRGDAGVFVLTVGPWCSSLAPVLAVAAVSLLAPGRARRRLVAALAASALLMIGNVVRLVAVIVVGSDVDPAGLEPFHDGPATAMSVVLVLSAAALVARSTLPDGRLSRPLRPLPVQR